MSAIFDKPLTYLPGVGERKAKLLAKELDLHTYFDLLTYYPFRYDLRKQIQRISELFFVDTTLTIQFTATLTQLNPPPYGRKVMTGSFSDGEQHIQALWFGNTNWMLHRYKVGEQYLLHGKVQRKGKEIFLNHPVLESLSEQAHRPSIFPIYRGTTLLKRIGLASEGLSKIVHHLPTNHSAAYRRELT